MFYTKWIPRYDKGADLEITGTDYNKLKELEAEHKKKGRKTYFDISNACEPRWSLVVEGVR